MTLSNLKVTVFYFKQSVGTRYLQSTIPMKIIVSVDERSEIMVILSLEKNGTKHSTKIRCVIVLLKS